MILEWLELEAEREAIEKTASGQFRATLDSMSKGDLAALILNKSAEEQGGVDKTAEALGSIGLKVRKQGLSKKSAARLFLKIASDDARQLGSELGVQWDKVDFTPQDLVKGMKIEKEHHQPGVDIIPDEELPTMTAKIALAHLKERGDYYDLLGPKVEEAPEHNGTASTAKGKAST